MSCVSATDCDSSSSEIISDSAPDELSEIQVSADASDELGDGSSQNPFKSLEYAVNNSENDSVIYLNDGEYAGEHNREIEIDKSITIIGKSKENTIINAESSGRVFNVASTGKLTLINITLINGYSKNGGLIYSTGGEINIKNCIVKNSSVTRYGGAIYNDLGTLNIEDSFFVNNSANKYGGVMYTLGTTSIKNSNFTENFLTADRGVGACIAAGGKIDLDGCSFYKCYTPYSAAALLNIGNATVNNCRFERLTTDYTAGAISNHKYILINNSYFGYNSVKYYAAAILAPPSGQHVITEVYNTIFERNHAGLHGAVSNNYPDAELFMQTCALIDNYIKLDKVYGDIALDDNATVQYCWWGKNEINPYYYSPHDNQIEPEKINASRWLIMTFTSSNDVIYRNEINQLTVSLRQYFDNETKEIYEYDEDFNLPLDVTFYTDSETLATKKLVNGVATFDFNPEKGVNAVYAKINNQILKISDFQLRETEIIADDFETYYGSGDKLVVTLIKDNNESISNESLDVSFVGSSYAVRTDENGQVNLSTDGLAPDVYNATITFDGNGKYIGSAKSVAVVIKKATPKLDATAKTFENNDKSKKYSVTLKDDGDNAIENVEVILEVNGETYNATTDSNGVATFYLEKLISAGNFTATVIYPGDDNYNNASANAEITVKSPSKETPKDNKDKKNTKAKEIVEFPSKVISEDSNDNAVANAEVILKSTWNTISYGGNDNAVANAKVTVKSIWKTIFKGSKDVAMIIKIQLALQKFGFYMLNGLYLAVDGIFGNYTEDAVKQFQKANGLNVTGEVDYETAKKLGIVE